MAEKKILAEGLNRNSARRAHVAFRQEPERVPGGRGWNRFKERRVRAPAAGADCGE